MPETKGKQPEEMSMYFRTNTFAFRQKKSSNQINIKKGEEQDDEVNSEGIITSF